MFNVIGFFLANHFGVLALFQGSRIGRLLSAASSGAQNHFGSFFQCVSGLDSYKSYRSFDVQYASLTSICLGGW